MTDPVVDPALTPAPDAAEPVNETPAATEFAPEEQAPEASAEPAGEPVAEAAVDPGVTVVPPVPQNNPPGEPVVGEVLAPIPGAQPGVVAPTDVRKNSADDPAPSAELPKQDDHKPQSADDAHPETTSDGSSKPLAPVTNTVAPPPAFGDDPHDGASTDPVVDDADEAPTDYSHLHPSKRPVAHRPTPAGPSSHPHTRTGKYGR